jgi:hypothetical protein
MDASIWGGKSKGTTPKKRAWENCKCPLYVFACESAAARRARGSGMEMFVNVGPRSLLEPIRIHPPTTRTHLRLFASKTIRAIRCNYVRQTSRPISLPGEREPNTCYGYIYRKRMEPLSILHITINVAHARGKQIAGPHEPACLVATKST